MLSLLPSSEHYEPNSEHYEPNSEHYKRLQDIAAPVRGKGRASKQVVEPIILELCSEHYLPLRTLAELLGREPDSIRNHYVNPMLDRGLLSSAQRMKIYFQVRLSSKKWLSRAKFRKDNLQIVINSNTLQRCNLTEVLTSGIQNYQYLR